MTNTNTLQMYRCLALVTASAVASCAPRAPGQPAVPSTAANSAPATAATLPARRWALDPARRARTADGATLEYQLGTIFVPERREAPDSREIGVGFAVIKSARPTAPPIFVLPGGPGVSLLDVFDQSPPHALLTLFARYREFADVVIVDQRGASPRGDWLAVTTQAEPLDRAYTIDRDATATIELARAAVAAYPQFDLRGYTVLECAADVDELRAALGYEHITLSGGSFGSQLSFVILRRYPGLVARAALFGVEPIDNGYDMPSHVFTAMQRIAWDADHDPRLMPRLPPGGLIAAARTVRDRLTARPIVVRVRDASGAARTVELGLVDFQAALRDHASNPQTWPAFILELYQGQYDTWANEVIQRRGVHRFDVIGGLIDTSLGVTPERRALLESDAGLDWLGPINFSGYLASAEAWPTDDVGDALRRPQLDRTPMLLMNGDWDVSTPIENTYEIAPYFPNVRVLTVHRSPHRFLTYSFKDNPAAMDSYIEFLRSGDLSSVPARIEVAAAPFALPPS
jgi:pimeloyl-ACP methyl ester carboxylesterase